MFSDLEMVEICGYINYEEWEQDSQTRIETLNTGKQEFPNRIRKQNSDNQNVRHNKTNLNARMQTKCRINKENHPLESKTEKVQVETKKVHKLFANIPTNNISELNELIDIGSKLVRDKIGLTLKTWMKNLARRTSKETATSKELKRKENKNQGSMLGRKVQNKTADKYDNATWRDK